MEQPGAKNRGNVINLESRRLPRRDESPLAGLTLSGLYTWAHNHGLFIREFAGSNKIGMTALVGSRKILGIGTPEAATPEFLLNVTVPGFGKTRESAVRKALDAFNRHHTTNDTETGQSAVIIDFRPRR